MAKNRYVKVALFERCGTRLQDAKVVGQGEDYLLLERAAPKVRTEKRKKKLERVNEVPGVVA